MDETNQGENSAENIVQRSNSNTFECEYLKNNEERERKKENWETK